MQLEHPSPLIPYLKVTGSAGHHRQAECKPAGQQTGQGGRMSLCPCSGPAKDLITAFTKRGAH